MPRKRHTNGTTHLAGDLRPQGFRHHLLTLDDAVECFTIMQGLKLANQGKKDIVVFMRALEV